MSHDHLMQGSAGRVDGGGGESLPVGNGVAGCSGHKKDDYKDTGITC